MLYDIHLRMSYAFGDTTASGRQQLRIIPQNVPGRQRVIATILDLQPRPHERADRLDFFSNTVVETAYREVRGGLSLHLQARIERDFTPPTLDLSPRLDGFEALVMRQRNLGPRAPHHFSGPSPRLPPNAAIADYARAATEGATTVLEAASAINNALFRDMRFDPEATDVDTPAGEAFANRHGVCQDFTHIMITALRSLGVPAGYVSGFLRTNPPEGQARLEGADAMHAWVMVWCGEEAGWIELDPTNGIAVASDHVLVAVGRDYADVAPVSGVLKMAGKQVITQAVDVVPVGGP
ncbi:MAG: transglutaminase family protein [Beijerinckiaceae bacterium]|jgi:transglutaminase-like putative cysteine protease|nr:transglutaminase family protein [Beijerinckiaceae bacterium]